MGDADILTYVANLPGASNLALRSMGLVRVGRAGAGQSGAVRGGGRQPIVIFINMCRRPVAIFIFFEIVAGGVRTVTPAKMAKQVGAPSRPAPPHPVTGWLLNIACYRPPHFSMDDH